MPLLCRKDWQSQNIRLLTSGGVLALFLYFALITHLRADLYGDDFRRTQIEADYRSESVRSQYEAGALRVNMYNQHRAPILAGFADKYFKRVNELDPDIQIGADRDVATRLPIRQIC